jgi:hypothetical protein
MTVQQRWTLDSIPWQTLRRDLVSDSEELFYLLATASFVESTTHIYTKNLIAHFAGDAEVTGWLGDAWLPEEHQHGDALKRYVLAAWPDFDWDGAYAGFFEEYSAYCRPESLMAMRGLEMVSRCVVEMGTASYYTALSRATEDPVLGMLAHNIFEDEVRHYKYFYKFFLQYREREKPSRARIAMTLWQRLRMLEDEDSYIALKHVYGARYPGRIFDAGIYKQTRQRCRVVAAAHFPHEMCIKMLLKPLDMGPWSQALVQPILEGVARRVVA